MKSNVLVKKTYRYLLRELKHAVSKKPYFLNYPTATLCNHKCVMCNIHEIKKKDEVAVDDLEHILSDPLFTNIESIGLSGGEPFMKKDLVEVISVLVRKLKSLRHFSINSNGQLPNRIKSWLPLIQELCLEHNVEFNVVLSMDGVGEVHNEVRGRPNAWDQIEKSFEFVRENEMTPSILMTIHKRNYQDVFNVFAYSLHNGIVPYFGIATVIERLGNEDIHDQFAISKQDRYYIWEFYQNLSKDKRFGVNKRIWYDMLSYQLLYSLKRKASCVAMNKGVYLSDGGKVSYCGVYDKELQPNGNDVLLDRFMDKANDLEIRQKMKEKHCDTCMHDYQSKPKADDIYRFLVNEYRLPQLKRVVRGEVFKRFNSNKKINKQSNNVENILLYGWFGTETTGDKAIYAAIISYFKSYFSKNLQFTIASKTIAYTERTLIELGLDDVSIIDANNLKDSVFSENDLFVYCGGPIMGYSDLYDHYRIVNLANRNGKHTMIFGAGFSHIENSLYRKTALSFIKQNDIVVLRDQQSLDLVNKTTDLKNSKSAITIDPAYIWAMDQHLEKPKNDSPVLGISFRVFPKEDFFNENGDEALNEKIEIYIKIANDFIENHGGKVVLIPMNTFHIGGDDRMALFKIAKGIENQDSVELLSGFYSPLDTLEAFAKCDFFIGMRFHSSVFSNALSIPTVGVEYVLPKGKVTNLFNTLELQENLINIDDLSYPLLSEKLETIIEKRQNITEHLNKKNQVLHADFLNSMNGVMSGLS
jgi:polysaccharide pyruvyl transferase WcaK-like protein/sulfatase maturation enzyme AslB (radical SAM superfamily)